jgi:putative transposase
LQNEARTPTLREMNTAGYKYRFYPTPEQEDLLGRTFGCVRAVYNRGLAISEAAYRAKQKRPKFKDLCAQLPTWKQEWPWLAEVSSVPVQQALRHLEAAYSRFFKRLGRKPTYKTKRGHQSASFMKTAFQFKNGEVWLAKMASPLAIRWSRALPGEPTSLTISRDPAGRWFVSFQGTVPPQAAPEPVNESVGVDLGLVDLVVPSQGERIKAPKYLTKRLARLRRAQRALARKQKGSRNREQARRAVARLHARVADQRRDFLHKTSTRLIRENQVVCIEDLDVRALARTRLARAIHDAGWGELRRQLVYKAEWYGREVSVIDRWFPSTRACSACGVIGDKLSLSVRSWECAGCGARHDRDENAALNIEAAGLAVSACGGDVRRGMQASRAAPAKQEPVS